MQVTHSTHRFLAWGADRTSHTLSAETVKAIEDKRCTDTQALALYDEATLNRSTVEKIAQGMRSIPGNRVSDPNAVVLTSSPASTPEDQTLLITGNADYAKHTLLNAKTFNPAGFWRHYYCIARAEDGHREVGYLYKDIDYQGQVRETVIHDDGGLTYTQRDLSDGEYSALTR